MPQKKQFWFQWSFISSLSSIFTVNNTLGGYSLKQCTSTQMADVSCSSQHNAALKISVMTNVSRWQTHVTTQCVRECFHRLIQQNCCGEDGVCVCLRFFEWEVIYRWQEQDESPERMFVSEKIKFLWRLLRFFPLWNMIQTVPKRVWDWLN